MGKKSVTILTGFGKGLGTGHFQRMLNLASSINSSGAFKAFICTENRGVLSVSPDISCVDEIPEETSLIIRDMRNSHPDEIKKLMERAPVLVVDDAGEGRFYADHRIDLLPGLYDDNDPREDLFLFGYHFTRSVRSITHESIEKTNDLLIYGGTVENRSFAEELVRFLPRNIKYTIADPKIESSYAKTLISSKLLLTHFGIMLFEALLSRCSVAVINPSEYHQMLTEKVTGNSSLFDLGQASDIDCRSSADLIIKIINRHNTNRIEIKKMRNIIDLNLKNFHEMIERIIS
jgi:hypothetical protein